MVDKIEQTDKVKVCLNVVLEGKHAESWRALQARLESVQLDLFDHVGPSTVLRYAITLASAKLMEDIARSEILRQAASKPN